MNSDPQTTNVTTRTPLVLDRLASLTAIRDLEVYQFSLLKTVAELLNISQASLYKLDTGEDSPCRILSYRAHEGGEDEMQTGYALAPSEIEHAREWSLSHDAPFTQHQSSGYLYIYRIYDLNGVTEFLRVDIDREMSQTDHLIVASLLRISKNFRSLLEENQKDKLTGLLNRKTFDDNLEKIQNLLESLQGKDNGDAQARERRHKPVNGFWLAIFDIDHFKRINDTYGHVFGDEVLLQLAQLMRANFRANDLLFRFGGEEFVIILQAAEQADAHQMLERFRLAVAQHVFPQVGQVTISIGATRIDSSSLIASELVGRADKALYFAKRQGRNRLCHYEDLVAHHMIDEHIATGSIELF